MGAVLSYHGGGVLMNFASVPEGNLEQFVFHLYLDPPPPTTVKELTRQGGFTELQLYLKVILNCMSVICTSPTRQSSRTPPWERGQWPLLYLKVILNCMSVICTSPTRQSSSNSSMREGSMTFAVPEGDFELYVCHLYLAHQTVVQ